MKLWPELLNQIVDSFKCVFPVDLVTDRVIESCLFDAIATRTCEEILYWHLCNQWFCKHNWVLKPSKSVFVLCDRCGLFQSEFENYLHQIVDLQCRRNHFQLPKYLVDYNTLKYCELPPNNHRFSIPRKSSSPQFSLLE